MDENEITITKYKRSKEHTRKARHTLKRNGK
jgi:hypothetical protein